ncbi:MAG: MATE family efflux transporter [Gemmiger sp.]|nr:MATE family efflux transporter [Gemmiger sp.]
MATVYHTQYDKMTRKPIPALVLELGLPTTISMLVTNLCNMADTWFVGQLGTSASGATGVVFALMAIIQAFGFMLGHGAGSNVSRQLGAKNAGQARVFSATSFYLSLFFGGVILVAGLCFLGPLVRVLGSTETIYPYARTYALYILLAAPALAASCVLNNLLRYEGRAAFAMVGLTAGSIINIFGDALLIFGFKMGIAGAGLSTMVSQYISMGILLSMFVRGKTQTSVAPRYITKNWGDVLNILRTGLPSLTRQGLGSISTMLLNWQAKIYGDAALAALSIVARIANFLFCVGLGIGQGFQPVCGFNYGAGKYSRVKKSFWFTMGFGGLLMGIFAVFGFIFAEPVVALMRNDPAVIAIGAFAMKAQCVALVVMPLSVCGNMLFQSIGLSGRATFLSCLRSGLCFMPLLLLFNRLWGLTGIQLAQPAADILAALISVPVAIAFFATLPPDTPEAPASATPSPRGA